MAEHVEHRSPGVDLADPAQEGVVRRIYWSRWAWRVEQAGQDPEDCYQMVCLGILARNKGKRPFDPAISSLSNYAYIVIRSVVANYLDSARRAARRGWVVGDHADVALLGSTG